MYNRGTKYLNKNNYLKALSFYKKETGSFKELYLNIGNCYRGLGNYSKAMGYYILANREDIVLLSEGTYGEYSLALNNMGMLYYGMGDDEMASACYKRALSLDPLYYDAIWNLANTTLRSTNCANGWDLYSYRFKRLSGAVKMQKYGVEWDGRTSGHSIVVLAEQGLGDKIMFSRYLSSLYDYFKVVHVQCHPSLDSLYSGKYNICRDASESEAEYSIGICSLAGIFGIIEENWLDGKFVAHRFPSGFNIGCVWAGSTTHVNNSNRSCPSSYFRGLTKFGNVYSLSPDAPRVEGVKALQPASWGETAAYVLGLDIVVTVDTSIVHLCGTLGVPCIMVQPLRETDFRWGRPGDRNVWYKSVVVVDNPNSWDVVFDHVGELLEVAREQKFYMKTVGMSKTALEELACTEK